MPRLVIFALIGLLTAAAVAADEVSLAVAANFIAPMQKIAAGFEKASGHKVQLSSGSTGKFYAQIRNGAPFEVLLAADDETPARLEKDGLAVAGSRFTYANGKLVLWSAKAGVVDERGDILGEDSFRHLALANPKLAPYGLAAIETLSALKRLDALRPKLVQAENLTQAHQFVRSGNAELGFLALSQLTREGRISEGSGWIVPPELYSPIRQDAVLLEKGRGKAAPQALLDYLRSEPAKAIIRAYGYAL